MDNERYITSQTERIEDIVGEKLREKDYEVQYVRLTMSDGETIRYIIDGHHSHEAARRAGVDPEYTDVTDEYETEIEYRGGTGEAFLEHHNCGEGWWEIETGRAAW